MTDLSVVHTPEFVRLMNAYGFNDFENLEEFHGIKIDTEEKLRDTIMIYHNASKLAEHLGYCQEFSLIKLIEISGKIFVDFEKIFPTKRSSSTDGEYYQYTHFPYGYLFLMAFRSLFDKLNHSPLTRKWEYSL